MRTLLLCVLMTIVSTQVLAGTWSLYGYGAQNQSLANSVIAYPTDAFAQSYNPALMAFQPKQLFGFGVEGAITQFNGINNVLTDRPDLGAATNTNGNVNTHTQDTFVATLGIQSPLARDAAHPLHIGLTASTPIERILGIETEDAFQPQYAMYLSDTQKFAGSLNLALALSDQWAVGIGAEMFLVQGSNATLRLKSGGNSTGRLKSEARPGAAPIAGVIFSFNQYWKIAATYKGKEDYQSELDANNYISIIPGGTTPLILTMTGSLYYDPEMYSLGVTGGDENNVGTLSARYQHWQGFNGTIPTITFQTFTGSFQQTLAPTPYHDVVSLHAGYEHKFSSSAMRLGYSYLPSPVPDQSGDSNVLDSDKHVFALGFGKWWNSQMVGGLLKLDLTAFLHYLTTKTITKISSNSIGYPGYTIGGIVYGYGVTLTLEY